jgi:hypothetical protein
MYTYINIVYWCSLCQVFLEVLHVCNQQIFFAGKVFIDLSIFIENMNDNNFLWLLILQQSRGSCILSVVYPSSSMMLMSLR